MFFTLTFAHVKKDKMRAQANRCIFIRYVKTLKGKLWRLEPREA